MGRISKALRFEILTRDGYKCRYCGASAQETTLHIDHVLPRAMGGRDDAANLVTACQPCNSGKSDRRILGIPAGFALTEDKRPARMAKMRAAAARNEEFHELCADHIDSLDEIDEDSQLSYVWCNTHQRYEWHHIHLDYVRYGGSLTVRKKEVQW